MTIKTKTSTLIETRTRRVQYGFTCREAIIDHPTLGRLWIGQNWGSDGIGGELVSWCNGSVVQLLDDDTFESLDAKINDYGMTILGRAAHGHDKSRPLLDWFERAALERLAASLGL